MKACKLESCNTEFKPKHKYHYFCCIDCKVKYYKSIGRTNKIMNRFNKSKKGKLRTKKYLSSEKGKKYNREKSARYRKNYPEKIKAVNIANRLLDNKLCEIKGCRNQGEKHHKDYLKPLEVRYLCKQHHMELHWQPELAYT